MNVDPLRQSDIYAVSLEGDRKPQVVVSTESNEHMCALSPDGKWLAYVSNETGREELYVRGFSGAGGKWQLSIPIYGAEPQWSRNGKQLLYRSGDGVGKVDVAPGATFSASPAKTIIPMTFGGYRPGVRAMFSVAPDGQRVLAIQASERDQGTDRINLVLGWGDELARLAAAARK